MTYGSKDSRIGFKWTERKQDPEERGLDSEGPWKLTQDIVEEEAD